MLVFGKAYYRILSRRKDNSLELFHVENAKQVSYHDGGEEKICKLNENDFTIINNKAVSRRHAVIERINGTYYLMDKGSTNHTYLNGEMMDAERSYELSDQDSIRIADEEFTFYYN